MGNQTSSRGSKSSSSWALIVKAPPVSYWNSNPYSVDVSPNGKLLAIGSGGRYGGGGITLVDLMTEGGDPEVVLRFGRYPPRRGRAINACGLPDKNQRLDLTVSGIAFDGSGDYLAVSTWCVLIPTGPVFVFRVVACGLEYIATFDFDDSDLDRGRPTGICWGDSGNLWVRHTQSMRRVETNIFSATKNRPHRSESRIATLGSEQAMTGIGGYLVMAHAEQPGQFQSFPPASTDLSPVTAVLSLSKGRLLSGHRDGSILVWEENDEKQWCPLANLQSPREKKPHPDILFATYSPSSIVAMCALENWYFFSADASGEILQWSPQGHVMQTFELPQLGTPRCLAVSSRTPKVPLLVVGVKAPQKGDRRGFVVCFSLELGWQQVGQWILMRRLVENNRAMVKTGDEGVVPKLLDLDHNLFRTILTFLLGESDSGGPLCAQ